MVKLSLKTTMGSISLSSLLNPNSICSCDKTQQSLHK